jgi:ABC-type lipoprotein export system ATPase subunit/GNAT superfamily N-acetyltransferase
VPTVRLASRVAVQRSKRVRVLESMFDLGQSSSSAHEMTCTLPIPDKYGIGAIIGPSGCGKSTLLRHLFGNEMSEYLWKRDASIVDSFPQEATMREIVTALSSVGFSSPPNWLRPYNVLSTGEQFRADIARRLVESAQGSGIVVVDEFTSTVDRQVAMSCCLALSKAVRRGNVKLIVASCHYDIVDSLQPDWIYEPHADKFTARGRVRPPQIRVQISRTNRDTWQLFRHHHYLSQDLMSNAKCFVGTFNKTPVVFGCMTPAVLTGKSRAWREHRTVTLPDYQGLGVGVRMSEFLGALCRTLAYQFDSTTSHPAMIGYRDKHPATWLATRARGFGKQFYSSLRLTATHRYIGPSLDDVELARRLWSNEEINDASQAVRTPTTRA